MAKPRRWLKGSFATLLTFLVACCAETRPLASNSVLLPPQNSASVSSEPEAPNRLASKNLQGIRLRLLTMDSPQIQSAFRQRAQEFEAATGAKIEIITLPFGELVDSIRKSC